MLAIWNILKLCIWYCLWPFGKFVVIWYIPPLVLVFCTKKNVAGPRQLLRMHGGFLSYFCLGYSVPRQFHDGKVAAAYSPLYFVKPDTERGH
jgi:hypothetical protein